MLNIPQKLSNIKFLTDALFRKIFRIYLWLAVVFRRGYGQTGQEPGLIMINYGTNDHLHHSNPNDTFASIVQSLNALRKSSPSAQIIIIIPFGQYFANELKKAVDMHKKTHPKDKKIAIIDLGQGVAGTLGEKNHLMGGLHPNDRGHANFTAAIIPQMIMILNQNSK